jgi:small subunit ribosomal protein S6
MNHYETILIFQPELSDEALDQLIEALQERLKTGGAEIADIEHWGKRRLAYAVRRERYGHYVLIRHQAPTDLIRQFENHLKISEPILKFLTVRVEPGAVTPSELLKERERSGDGDAAEEAPAPPEAAPLQGEEETKPEPAGDGEPLESAEGSDVEAEEEEETEGKLEE